MHIENIDRSIGSRCRDVHQMTLSKITRKRNAFARSCNTEVSRGLLGPVAPHAPASVLDACSDHCFWRTWNFAGGFHDVSRESPASLSDLGFAPDLLCPSEFWRAMACSGFSSWYTKPTLEFRVRKRNDGMLVHAGLARLS